MASNEDKSVVIKNNVTKKTPPVLEDSTVYESCRKDIALWRAYTDLEVAKQGVPVH